MKSENLLLKAFFEKYPQCPNPVHYPRCADFFINMLLYYKTHIKKEE